MAILWRWKALRDEDAKFAKTLRNEPFTDASVFEEKAREGMDVEIPEEQKAFEEKKEEDDDDDDDGVQVLDLSKCSWPTFAGAKKNVLLTRRHTRGVYDYLWAAANQNKSSVVRYAVVGNPGIGKSAGLTYALRLALKDDRVVLFHVKPKREMFLFVPTGDDEVPYKAYVTTTQVVDESQLEMLKCRDLVFIFDPSNEKGMRSPPYPAAAMTIYAASPSADNFKGLEHVKSCYIPPWDFGEFAVAASILRPELEAHEVEKRWEMLGGTLRYALSEDFGGHLRKQGNAVHSTDIEKLQTYLISPENADGVTTSSYLVAIMLNNEEMEDPAARYDINNMRMDFLSRRAVALMMAKTKEHLVSLFKFYSPRDATAMGLLFEEIALQILQRNDASLPEAVSIEDLIAWKQAKAEKRQLPSVRTLRVFPKGAKVRTRPGMKHKQLDQAAGELHNECVLAIPVANYPAIDGMALRPIPALPSVGLQVTICQTHSIQKKKCEDLCAAMNRAAQSTGEKLPVVFVVPWFCREAYETKLQTAKEKKNGSLDCVEQYVLVIEEDMFFDGISKVPFWEAASSSGGNSKDNPQGSNTDTAMTFLVPPRATKGKKRKASTTT